jgi:hypothetical protein
MMRASLLGFQNRKYTSSIFMSPYNCLMTWRSIEVDEYNGNIISNQSIAFHLFPLFHVLTRLDPNWAGRGVRGELAEGVNGRGSRDA